ncbi:MAG: TIGR03564 family F420-dependent LLM class oxidoreductase [Acidimicrobiales bacterium]|nr:TIGR03564 family F420-dependent LLM class oxidoreductase [Acidimicrobiales bacterium]
MRIGINGSSLLFNADVGAVIDDIRTADEEGFRSYWLGQFNLLDAMTTMTAAAPSTEQIEFGTAVVPTWTSHPMAMATRALTAQSLCGGRLTLGIGLAHKPSVEEGLHLTWEKPVRHMLDYLEVLSSLFATGSASYRGEIWSLETEGPRPTDAPPKLMLAALGDQMLRIAGRRTDGTILWCVGPKAIETHIAPRINEAAADADRPAPSVVCSVPCWVTDEPAKAREFIGSILAHYAELPSYRAMLDIEGIHGLEDLSFVGSEQEVRDRIGAVEAAGATDFTGVVMGADPDEVAATRELLASL